MRSEEELQAQIGTLTEQLKQAQQEITGLQKRIESQNQELKTKQARIEQLVTKQEEEDMTTHNHESLPSFNPGRDQAMVGDKWDRWLEVWDLYLASQSLNEKDNQSEYKNQTLKPLFLLKIGDEAREIYNGKRKADHTDKLSEIIKFMSEHYKPKRSVFAYVSIFYKAKRFEGESVNEYVSRLRLLAKPCKFEQDLDKELLRAFVFGCGIIKVEEMMAVSDNKTVAEAIECGLKFEHQLEDLKQIRAVHTQNTASGGTINQVNRNYNPTQQNVCGWCGKEQHARQQCPAKEKTCNKCGLIGHYGSVCRKSKTDQTTSQNGQNRKYSRHSSKQDNKMDNSNTMAAIHTAGSGYGSGTIQMNSQEYDEYQRFRRWSEWEDGGVNMVVDGSNTTDPNTLTKIDIDGTSIRVMVDTGAAVNAINERSYNGLANKPKLEQLVGPLYGFGNPSTPLQTLGRFEASMEWNGSNVNSTIVVMRGNKHQNLVGRRTAVELGMVTLNVERLDLNQIGDKRPKNEASETNKRRLSIFGKSGVHKLNKGKVGPAAITSVRRWLRGSNRKFISAIRHLEGGRYCVERNVCSAASQSHMLENKRKTKRRNVRNIETN
jgi:hypothetical protein